MKRETSGHFLKSLRAIIQCVQHPPKYFAKVNVNLYLVHNGIYIFQMSFVGSQYISCAYCIYVFEMSFFD